MKFIRASYGVIGFHISMSEESTGKAKLRSKMKAYLASVSKERIQSSSSAIAHHIAAADDLLNKANTIALYAAIQKEISLSELHQLLPGRKFAYPLCQPNRRLTFHHVESETQLAANAMQIPEPLASLHPEINTAEIDIVLCPGLAFGSDGSRLGRGQGYYDRALEDFSGIKLGISLDHQIIETVPHTCHDAAMDYLVSESGISATKPLQG